MRKAEQLTWSRLKKSSKKKLYAGSLTNNTQEDISVIHEHLILTFSCKNYVLQVSDYSMMIKSILTICHELHELSKLPSHRLSGNPITGMAGYFSLYFLN